MRVRNTAGRLLVLVTLVGALSLLAGPALATSGTGSQNPGLTVAVSLTNSGGDADDVDTATVAFDLPVEDFFPIGAYDLTAATSNRHGTSSATASLEIV
jgi:hypothetical protein